MLPDNQNELFYRIALTFVKDVGVVTATKLIHHFGTASEIFRSSLKDLKAVSGLGEVRTRGFKDKDIFSKAEDELKFIDDNNTIVLWIQDESYPKRLKQCTDAPILIYQQGDVKLDQAKVISIIGTRKYTDYGQRACEQLLEQLSGSDILVVSGLAHGIDTIAHKASLQNNLSTVGVLGHGLDKMYPVSNKKLAKDMLENGGLLSEYCSGTNADRNHFPMRNRIVAGLSDVTIVVESDIKGGAMITARLADSYNRDVAAFPGRIFDSKSSGCNELIRTNVAAMITSADDLLELMNWKDVDKKPVQKQLFINLSEDEKFIYDLLNGKDNLHADAILQQTNMTNTKLAATLLQMEMQGLVKALPGKLYRLD